MKVSVIISILLAFLSACGSIPVDESAILQPKRSVTPQTFDRLGLTGYTLDERFFEAHDGTVLNGWYVSRSDGDGDPDVDLEANPDAERVTVVFFGGNGFYLVQSAPYLELFAELEVDVFMWDYRGYGLSEGEPSLASMKADSLAAIDFAVDALGVDGPVIAHGHSIGTFIASYAAVEREADAMVLESPATNADHWLRSALPGVVRMLADIEVSEALEEEDNIPRVESFTAPSYFAVGEDDFTTPPDMAERLYETSEASWKRLYEQSGGGHNTLPPDTGFRSGYRALIDEVMANR